MQKNSCVFRILLLRTSRRYGANELLRRPRHAALSTMVGAMSQGHRRRTKSALASGAVLACLALPHSGNPAFCQAAGDPAQQIDRLAQQAAADLHNQKLTEAAADYRRILALDPGNVSAHSNLGLAYYLQNNYAQAAGEFEIALRRQPDLWNIVALCGLSEAQSGKNADAVIHLQQAFDNVREPSLRRSTGRKLFSLLMETGDLSRAAQVIDQLQRIDPGNVDVLYAAHQVYSLLAEQAFQSLALLDPDSARMYQLQGDEMAQLGDVPGAIAAYRAAIARDPHLSGVHFALAEALSASHVPVEQATAEAEYKAALADDPWDEKAECSLGNIELRRSNLQAASLHFQRALELQPDDAGANEGMGLVLMASGSNRQAIAFLTRAVEASPDDETAYYRLSLADRNAGDMTAAARAMEQFEKLKAKKDQLQRNFRDLRQASPHSAANSNPSASAAPAKTPAGP